VGCWRAQRGRGAGGALLPGGGRGAARLCGRRVLRGRQPQLLARGAGAQGGARVRTPGRRPRPGPATSACRPVTWCPGRCAPAARSTTHVTGCSPPRSPHSRHAGRTCRTPELPAPAVHAVAYDAARPARQANFGQAGFALAVLGVGAASPGPGGGAAGDAARWCKQHGVCHYTAPGDAGAGDLAAADAAFHALCAEAVTLRAAQRWAPRPGSTPAPFRGETRCRVDTSPWPVSLYASRHGTLHSCRR